MYKPQIEHTVINPRPLTKCAQIYKNGANCPDHWHLIQDINDPKSEHLLNTEIAIILPYHQWLQNRHEKLADHRGKMGIHIDNTETVNLSAEDLTLLELICLKFPVSADGRAFSQAAILRQKYQYKRELRAIGDIQIDQLFLMVRCGFDAFALDDDQAAQANHLIAPFTVEYQ